MKTPEEVKADLVRALERQQAILLDLFHHGIAAVDWKRDLWPAIQAGKEALVQAKEGV